MMSNYKGRFEVDDRNPERGYEEEPK